VADGAEEDGGLAAGIDGVDSVLNSEIGPGGMGAVVTGASRVEVGTVGTIRASNTGGIGVGTG